MNNLNVIIADDHPIVLFGIRKSLERLDWINVVAESEDSTTLINNLSCIKANVLITDLSMPGDTYGDGINLIKYIKRHYPRLSIIVLTMNNNPAILSAVLELDIEGIVLKQGAPTDLPDVLTALKQGEKFMPESVSELLKKSDENPLRRQTIITKRERGHTPVCPRLPGKRHCQKTQSQCQNNQQPEKISNGKAGGQ